MIRVSLSIPQSNLSQVLEQYTELKLYSDITATGTFTNLVTTITLSRNAWVYWYDDTTGVPGTTWYSFTYYNPAGSIEGIKSTPFLGGSQVKIGYTFNNYQTISY